MSPNSFLVMWLCWLCHRDGARSKTNPFANIQADVCSALGQEDGLLKDIAVGAHYIDLFGAGRWKFPAEAKRKAEAKVAAQKARKAEAEARRAEAARLKAEAAAAEAAKEQGRQFFDQEPEEPQEQHGGSEASWLLLPLCKSISIPWSDSCEEIHSLHMLQHHSQRRNRFSSTSPNPDVLVWNEVGQYYDGTLRVKLDIFDPDSPNLTLPVYMRPATEQPAPKGILLMHCGGPGSTRDCVYYTDGPHLEGYDVFAITQRGMEGTTPSLNCDNSKLPETCPPEGCQACDFTDCPCALLDGTPQLGEIWADLDPANESQVLNLFNKRQAWGPRCAASEKFQLRGRGGKMYNFLNYVGTQFLVYDLDEMRKAVGAENLSIYGYSYGTYVGGVYASVFSQSTGRVVLDGDMEASPRKDAQSTGDAVANDALVERMVEWGNGAAKASECSLKDPHVTYAKLVQRARAGKLTAPTESGMDFPLSVGLLMAYLQAESVSNSGRHTNEYESAPGISFADPYLEKCAVWGLDLAGYYDVSNLMHQWTVEKISRGDAGLAAVVGDMAGYFLRPLIVGNLFDSATSYSWAQDMKKAFPDGSIITWQGLGHTFPTYATDYNRQAIAHCWSHIEDYLQNGTMPINGLLCWQKEDPKVGGQLKFEPSMNQYPRRRRSEGLRWRKKSRSDYAGINHIHHIFSRGTKRYKQDLRLWYQHLDFCLRSGSSNVLTRVLMKAVKYHPRQVSLWLLAADRELQQGHVDAARKLLMRGLRCLPTSAKLLGEFLRLEVGVAGQLLSVQDMEDEQKDVWGPTKLVFKKGLAKLEGKADATATFLSASLALLQQARSKWASSCGFQEWSDSLTTAAASRRPGLVDSESPSSQAGTMDWKPVAREEGEDEALKALVSSEAAVSDPQSTLSILQEMTGEPIVVTVCGAAGHIGYSLLPMIAAGELFGPGRRVTLQCLDLNLPEVMDSMRGMEMEMQDGNFPLLHKVVFTTDDSEAFQGADYAILLGAFPKQDGLDKREIMEKNVMIFRTMGRALEKHVKPDCKVLVVGNPAHTNAWICAQHAPSLRRNIFALTRLDQNRATGQMAHHFGIAVHEIRNVVVWGCHAKFPDVDHAVVKGKPLMSCSDADRKGLNELFRKEMQQRGASIVKARKASIQVMYVLEHLSIIVIFAVEVFAIHQSEQHRSAHTPQEELMRRVLPKVHHVDKHEDGDATHPDQVLLQEAPKQMVRSKLALAEASRDPEAFQAALKEGELLLDASELQAFKEDFQRPKAAKVDLGAEALIDTEQAEQDQDQAELAWSSQPYASSFGPNGAPVSSFANVPS
eukprot:g19691.t1